jgi:NADH:ubiquinone oxidoreductase subunit 2 (subunit N)
VLATLGVLNSVVGAYYYLRIVVLMYLGETPEQQEEVRVRGGWPVATSPGTYAG